MLHMKLLFMDMFSKPESVYTFANADQRQLSVQTMSRLIRIQTVCHSVVILTDTPICNYGHVLVQ